MSNNRIRLYATSALTAATISLLPMQAAKAAPQGGVVVGGTASISTTGSATNINQTTNRAAINWTSFNVAPTESVTFTVPNNGATLNRVVGNESSLIQGTVTSNGTIYLVNPNGIVFDAGSQVTAQNFIATTSNIDPANFMSGDKFTTDRAPTNARIDLKGTITVADRGIVGIFSPHVSNSGTITANLGQVTLGGVQTTVVDFTGDGLMSFEVGTSIARRNNSNANETMQVENHGTITANGGAVTLTVEGANDLLNAMINSDGNIDVTSLTAKGGNVTIQAVNGSITESGNIDASGALGGGDVKLWATENAGFNGNIKAEALTNSNGAYDGGFVEVSGLKNLGFSGTVSTLSLSGGKVGTLLLDPTDIVVESTGTGSFSAIPDGKFSLSAATILSALNSNNVTLSATDSIVINETINWSSSKVGRVLTLNARAGGVTVNSHFTIYSDKFGGLIINTTNGGNVNINGHLNVGFLTISSNGGVSGIGSITNHTGALTINAMNNISFMEEAKIISDNSSSRAIDPGNAYFTSTNGNVSIASIEIKKYVSDAAYNAAGWVTINATNGSVSVNGKFAGLSGASKTGWSSTLSSDLTTGTITNSTSGGVLLSSTGKLTATTITSNGSGIIDISSSGKLTANTIINYGAGGIKLRSDGDLVTATITSIGDGGIKITSGGDLYAGLITNVGVGGIVLKSDGHVQLHNNLLGGKGDVIVATTGSDKSVTLINSMVVTGAVGKSLYVLSGSGGFVAKYNTLTAYTIGTNGSVNPMDMYYYGGAMTRSGVNKVVNLLTGKFTYQLIGVAVPGEAYSLRSNYSKYDFDMTTIGQKITAASTTKVNGLIVAGGGSISIADISAPSSKDSSFVYAADLNYITANGITVSGKNVFSGDLTLVSYGSVGAIVTDDPSRAGISFRSSSSLNVVGSLVLENQANMSTTVTTGSAFGILIDNSSLTAGNDLKISQYGTISATGQGGNAYGIDILGGTLTAGKDLILTQSGSISATVDGGSAYGIDILGGTLTAGKDLTLTQSGSISATVQGGSAYGIDIVGSSSGSVTLTAGNDINFTQSGKISSDGSSAFGILLDGSINRSVAMTSKGGHISMTQSGAIIGKQGSVYGVFLNGYKATKSDTSSISLSAFGNVTMSQTSDISTEGNLSAGLGIYLYNSSIRAINGDITLNQNTGKVTDYRGGAYGIYILGTGSKTTNGKAVGDIYSLYAGKDILLTQNGDILSDGNQNYAAGITMDGAKIFAGHNILGVQAGTVSQNYNGTDSGYQIMNSDLRAGYSSTASVVKKSGSIILQQSGDINRTNDVTKSSSDDYKYRDQSGIINTALVSINAANPANPANAASNFDPTKRSAPFTITKSPAHGFFIDNSTFKAINDITINQTGAIGANPNSENGIIIAASSTAGTSFDAGESVNLTSGTNGTNGNGVYLYSSSSLSQNSNVRPAGKFTVKSKVLHIDLSGGEFNAGNQQIDATTVGNLVVTLPYGVDDNESADGGTNTAYIKGGKGGIAINLGKGTFTRVTTTLDADQNGKFLFKNVPGLNNQTNVTIDGNFATSGNAPTVRLDNYIPANIRAIDVNDDQRTVADFTGIKAMGVVTINGTANGELSTDAQNLAWIEGTSVKVTGNTTFNNSVTIVASGKFANIQQASAAVAATATKAAIPAVTGIYAGITIEANLTTLTSAEAQQVNSLTLIQNASNVPDRKTGNYSSGYGADNNAYGVYVTSKGSLGTVDDSSNLTIIQNGDITAKGAGRAKGIYIAGSIYQDGATAYSNGKIKADATGSASNYDASNGVSLNNR